MKPCRPPLAHTHTPHTHPHSTQHHWHAARILPTLSHMRAHQGHVHTLLQYYIEYYGSEARESVLATLAALRDAIVSDLLKPAKWGLTPRRED
jgi:hypothetical protein